jgi:NhaA family Na+:H+ antiporter
MSTNLPPARTTRLPIEVLMSPFVSFAKMEAASGIVLVASTVAALVWANSHWAASYYAIWNAPVSIGFGKFALTETRHDWINDGLMPIFFFLVGLEIKREVLVGELSSPRKAAFPVISAVGGAIVPAILYLLIAHGEGVQTGWAVPMATDIAFVIGALALLGSRVPVSLKVFVTAVAIADDLLAVLVIAFLYTQQIHIVHLVSGAAGLALCFLANRLGVRQPAVYAIIGVFVWYGVLQSGVHATVAGILLALTIPARTYVDRDSFLKRSRWLIDQYEAAPQNSPEADGAVHEMASQLELVESPLQRFEHSLHPWVSFVILPLFALSNLGIPLLGNVAAAARHPVALGVAIGLFIGKPIGVWLSARTSVKFRLATAPADLSWGDLFGAAWLCGIGFTMALFVATLAFADETLLYMAKLGVLAGSLASGVCASLFLIRQTRSKTTTGGAQLNTDRDVAA